MIHLSGIVSVFFVDVDHNSSRPDFKVMGSEQNPKMDQKVKANLHLI